MFLVVLDDLLFINCFPSLFQLLAIPFKLLSLLVDCRADDICGYGDFALVHAAHELCQGLTSLVVALMIGAYLE